jgi:hypothetical protein
MNFYGTRSEVTKVLRDLGISAKVNHASGGVSNCFICWGKVIASDLDSTAASMVTVSNREAYISYTKKEPACGDLLRIGKNEYGINDVQQYIVKDVLLCYKILVDN